MTAASPTLGRALRAASLVALAAASGAASALDAPLLADSSISSAQPTLNLGALPTLTVGGGANALLQFDLGTLPAGKTPSKLVKATLLLWINRVGTPGLLELLPITSPWTETGVTAASAPTHMGPGSGSLLPVNAGGQFVAVDVTAQVKSWIANPASNFGFALLPALLSPSTVAFLDSKENTTTGHQARLDLTLSDQGPAGPQGAQGPAGPKGPQGATGPQGAPGAMGPQGAPGTTGPQGAPGATGAQGPQGAQGAAGLSGASGVSGYSRQSSVISIPASFLAALDIGCPSGKKVLSGGFQLPNGVDVNTALNIVSRQSYPSSDTVWTQWIANTSGAALNITIWAVCASAL